MRVSILILLLLQSGLCAAQQEGFIKKFSGTIGKMEIVADIEIIDTIFSGSYYYARDMNPFLLRGTFKNLNITASEETDDSITGTISGKMSDDGSTITGTWKSLSKKKAYPFQWKEISPEGSAVLHVISKQYQYVWKKNKNGAELGCKSFYSLCYITGLANLQAKKSINDELLEADVDQNANDDALKDAATEFMDGDFDSYHEDFDTAFAGSETEEDLKWMNESPASYQWKKSQTCEVLFNENNLLTLQVFDERISGGARFYYECTNMVFDLRTGEELQLDELFKPDSRDQLNKLAQLQLLSKFKAGSLEQLDEKGFQLHGSFSASYNFFVQKNGIGFTYNQDEVPTPDKKVFTILIPWSSLQQLINPNGPVAWALKK
jgi:hypothetical protein